MSPVSQCFHYLHHTQLTTARFGAVIDEEVFLFTLGNVLGPPEAYTVQDKLDILGRY